MSSGPPHSASLEQLAELASLLPDPVLVRDAHGIVLGCNGSFARLLGKTPGQVTGRALDESIPPRLAERFRQADRGVAAVVRFHVNLVVGRDQRRRYLFRQNRFTASGIHRGWVTTAREAPTSTVDAAEALTIARTLANRNYSKLRESFPHVLKLVADGHGARGAVVLWKTGDRGELVALCRWDADESFAAGEDAESNWPAPSWWADLAQFEPLRDIHVEFPRRARCDVFPIHAQWQLLGALILVEPRRAGNAGTSGLAEFAATLFAGLMVRREIEKLLNEYSADLEKRVYERTADLNVAYETLKQAQAQLVQAGKMASIGQLAAGIAHEINNPIGFVKSNLVMLEDYSERMVRTMGGAGCDSPKLEDLTREIREMLAESREGIRRVEDIVANLRDFARIEEGHQSRADVNRLIGRSLRVMENQFKYKVTVHRDLGDVPEIQCRPDRLEQVFVNLLMNAVQATEDQGEIRISTGVDEGMVMIRIADNGVGIDPEDRERIFEPFFTTKDVGSGTGLGLSIVWDIIQSHEGTITVESTPGNGTEFTISLPVDTSDSSGMPDFDAIMRDL